MTIALNPPESGRPTAGPRAGGVVAGVTPADSEPGLTRYVLVRLLDGATQAELLDRVEDRRTAVDAAIDRLIRDGLVEPSSRHPTDATVVIDHVRARARRRARGSGLARLRRLAYGNSATTARRALLAELAYMRGLAGHVRAAIDRSPPRIAQALRVYLAEEEAHVGPVGAAFGATPGIPGPAAALLGWLGATAATSLPAYLTAMAVLEGSGTDVAALDAEFALVAATGLPEPLWRPFHRHAVLDATEGHGDLFGRLLADTGPLVDATLRRCLGVADDLADHLVGFFELVVEPTTSRS